MQVGAKVVDICYAGDKMITDECAKMYKKKKTMLKGVAFPTCISVNNVVGHFCPVNDDDATTLAEGDVVKIDLGVHYDGWISTFAHTVVATDKPAEVITGARADVVCAAYFAAEAAFRQIRPGCTNHDVTATLGKVAADFGVQLVQGVLSHQLHRQTLDGEDTIISVSTPEHHVEEVKFEAYQAWSLDVIMTTGEGKPKLGDAKSGVFKRNPDERYMLKQKSSAELQNHIKKTSGNLAWSLRQVKKDTSSKALLGLKEMSEHNLLHEYPVLCERPKDLVAQFKYTILVLPTRVEKLNNAPLPYVSSEKKVENPDVQAVMALPLTLALPGAVAAAAAGAADAAPALVPAEEKK